MMVHRPTKARSKLLLCDGCRHYHWLPQSNDAAALRSIIIDIDETVETMSCVSSLTGDWPSSHDGLGGENDDSRLEPITSRTNIRSKNRERRSQSDPLIRSKTTPSRSRRLSDPVPCQSLSGTKSRRRRSSATTTTLTSTNTTGTIKSSKMKRSPWGKSPYNHLRRSKQLQNHQQPVLRSAAELKLSTKEDPADRAAHRTGKISSTLPRSRSGEKLCWSTASRREALRRVASDRQLEKMRWQEPKNKQPSSKPKRSLTATCQYLVGSKEDLMKLVSPQNSQPVPVTTKSSQRRSKMRNASPSKQPQEQKKPKLASPSLR